MGIYPFMKFGKESSYDYSPDLKGDIDSAFEDYKSVEDLLNIADSFTSLPNGDMEKIFKDSISHAGNSIAQYFFNQDPYPMFLGGKNYTALRDNIAAHIICQDIFFCVPKFNFKECIRPFAPGLELILAVSENKEMGCSLLTEVLYKFHGFEQYVENRNVWLPKLEKILSNRVYIIGTLVKDLSGEGEFSVKMKLFFLKALGSEKISAIEEAWVQASSQRMMTPIMDFIDNYNPLELVKDWVLGNPFQSKVIDACYKSSTYTTHETRYADGPLGLYPYDVTVVHTTYGGLVAKWLDSNYVSSELDLTNGNRPNNVISHISKGGGGCFLSGCKVLLSDASSKSIEDLKPNDQISGNDGAVGIVSSEMVVNEFEADIPIFGFNDLEPFFTAGHAFWTQNGWRAIDPYAAKEENHWLEVGQLSEGDYVKKAVNVNGPKISYEWVKIETIHSKIVPAGTKVYGVHLREGPRSYHANGFLVCLNYPEITLQNVAERMHYLSIKEKKELQEQMDNIQPILKKVIGTGPAKAMEGLTRKYLAEKLSAKMHRIESEFPLKKTSLYHMNLTYKAGTTKSGLYSMPSKMSIIQGKLFLDDKIVSEEATSLDGNRVSWIRTTNDGRWEHGAVKLLGIGHIGHGYIAITKSRDGTKSDFSANFQATSDMNNYTCYRSKNPVSKENTPPTEWIPFGKLSVGINCEGGNCKTVTTMGIPMKDNSKLVETDISKLALTTFNFDKDQNLTVSVLPKNGSTNSILGYHYWNGTFSWDSSSFNGTCKSYVTKAGEEAETYHWKGEIETDIETKKLIQLSKEAFLKEKIDAPVNSLASEIKRVPMTKYVEDLTDDQLSVEELFTITPPDSTTLHHNTLDLLQTLSQYEMADSLRENVFGVSKPDPSGDEKEIADDYKDFFGKTLANANATNALLGKNSAYKPNITSDEKTKYENRLLYFWNGNGKDCFSKLADYNKANNQAARLAFIGLCPTLSKYLNSSEGPKSWAKKLNEKLNEDQVLTQLAIEVQIQGNKSNLQKHSMVLSCLDPDENYGPKLYKTVLMKRLNYTSSFFKGNDEAIMTKMFTDCLHELVFKILAGSDNLTPELQKKVSKDITKLTKEYNIDLSKAAKEIADELINSMGDIIHDVLDIFSTKTGNGWDRWTASLYEWSEKNPGIAGRIAKSVSSLFSMAFFSMGYLFTVITLMQWDNLNLAQRTQIVLSALSLSLKAISKVPAVYDSYLDLIMSPSRSLTDKINISNAIDSVTSEDFEQNTSEDIQHVENVTAEEVDQEIARASSEVSAESAGSRWTKFFDVTEKFSKLTGLLSSTTGAFLLGYQIYNDFKNGAPVVQKAMDICQLACDTVALICDAVGFFVEAAVVPIIGTIAAIIGIVFAFVSMFVHTKPKPPPNPVDIYFMGDGKKFLDGLTDPTQKWLDDYHAKHKKK